MSRYLVTVGEQIMTSDKTIGENILHKELIYLGQNGTSFTIGYRESFGGSMCHAAYETLIYEKPALDAPTRIAFRGARFTVYVASNTAIEYEFEFTDDADVI